MLGTVAMPPAVKALVELYADKRPDGARARGEAVLAVMLVDAKGRPMDDAAPSVSSFGWGLPIALRGDLSALGAWRENEQRLSELLAGKFHRTDAEGNVLPVDRAQVAEAHAWLVNELKLDPNSVRPPSFAIRSFQYYKSNDPPDSLLLNSFYLADLDKARSLFAAGRAPETLKRYLGVVKHALQRDLLRDDEALAECVAPNQFPLARWPVKGRHALSLLQQAAVNLSGPVTATSSLLAVNGPPGTGKTTLLRDIVAARVTERAKAMCAFADPEAAFQFSQVRMRTGQAWTAFYKLPDTLRGHEIVVASTNNKAVENVSAELPTVGAVAEDSGLRYFKVLSDKVLERDTWGAIAAVLGNAANRSRFRQRFWWDGDFGFMTYLVNAAGTPRPFEIKDEDGHIIESRPPQIVTAENAPRDHRHALTRWEGARRAFRAAFKRSEEMAEKGEVVRRALKAWPEAKAKRAAMGKAHEISQGLADHWQTRPGFWSRLFRSKRFREWRAQEELLREHLTRACEIAALDRSEAASATNARAVQSLAQSLSARSAIVRAKEVELAGVVEEARSRLGKRLVDDAFFEMTHEDRHVAAPWFTDEEHKARDDVFVATMNIHKAFIDAAAKPLRNNLSAFLNVLGGRSLGSPERDALIPHLWSSLFLVVPVVSTTFASVERMLGALQPKEFGWLLIDEAGQAAPQAAVGALMRAERAVIVGDPMQIEPVVMLPETLTGAICRHFGVDPDLYDAPAASAQTLADAATPYASDFESRQGTPTVGVPLLVHRRCAKPMFSVSNSIAYENLMVFATPKRSSHIRDVLGSTQWFHLEGGDVERFCPEEARLVCRMLQKLRDAQVTPNLYIVAPFVRVAEGLKKAILDSRVIEGWVEGEAWRWVYDRVGTVHTVQGREAEAVIFVLGAQAPQRTGARNWAGGRPNLVNVAVTRAQEVLYVVGNRELWKGVGYFKDLHARMPG